MANVIQTATNRFSKGLVLDLSPETTSNEVLTNALNATFLTFNGNELSLQNDMGNARVETAYLPEGYIPVGTCEYGGIIYIVSYNPLEDKSLIGCFPSPERNISNEELGIEDVLLKNENFVEDDGNIINTSHCVVLKNNALNPGDKFIITASPEIFESDLKDLVKNDSLIENPVIALNIVSIEDSGKITYLNSDVRYYDVKYPEDSNNSYKYYILGSKSEGKLPTKQDIDDYRNVLSSGYSIFKSKISGKLAILAELITIDSYSVTHSIEPLLNGSFQIILHPEISPELTSSNYTTTPKLKYYYLQNSLGFLSTFDNNGKSNNIPLFKDDNFNSEFGKVSFKSIYNDVYNIFTEDEKLDIDLFDFPKPHTYHVNAKGNFLAGNTDTDLSYNDISLAYLTIPEKLIDNGIDLPFKYDYTITPCMRFGKLTNLSVSNTIDFSNLHAFNKSQFTTWKYRIDGEQLKLTFGAEVFDTFETYKVDALVLEFYDLWGFAGSLEITNKKSYNGVFTKIISLNSKDALSNKKIKDNTYITDYKHNINITEEDEIGLNGELEKVYKYNNVKLTYNADTGWSGINEADNDCGVLYSNILYGVKSYLRVDKNGTKEFIPKREMFLYTLPLYNEYYNRVNDFNNLEYPELEFNLTYRLEDYGNKMYYHDNDNFIQGYFKDDNVIINQYLSGNYNKSNSIHTTRYYKYHGTSKLYIELGLNKNYEALNISYDPLINEYFNCELRLLGDDGVNNYSIYSNSDSIPNNQTALNYLPDHSFKNTLTINGNGTSINLIEGIRQYNFITNPANKNININYSFIVGYNVTISDIAKTTIPATTICALYHKTDDGTYNLDDFSLYELEKDSVINYLSTCVFFNSGDHKTEQLSYGCQMTTDPVSIVEQCKITQSVTNGAKNITTSGKLNTTIVNEFMSHIGKLSIGQPHTHVVDNEHGANISVWTDPDDVEFKYWGLFNNISLKKVGSAGKDKTYGIAPANEGNRILNERTYQISNLYKYPKYNFCVNTKNFINYNHEFISALDYATTDYGMQRGHDFVGKESDRYDPTAMRLYTGFSAKEISTFNKKLLNTMSKIYAYNPDYDTILVLKGNVTLQNYSPSFKSNILVTKPSLLDEVNLNDYIYLGFMLFTKYLSNLNKHSNISVELGKEVKSLLQFKANLQSCGNDDLYGLVSSLTYNTLIPTELLEELSIDTSNKIVIKHSNGTINLMDGDFDRRTLYGYIPDLGGKMLQLDVSNYRIDTDGDIVIDSEKYKYEYINDTISKRELKGEGKITVNFESLTSNIKLVKTFLVNGYEYNRDITINLQNGIITAYDYLDTKYLYIITQPNLDISYTIEIDNTVLSTEELTALNMNASIKEKALTLSLLLLNLMEDKSINYEKLLMDNPDDTVTIPLPNISIDGENPILPLIEDWYDPDVFNKHPVNNFQKESLLYINDKKSLYQDKAYSLEISKFKTLVDENTGVQSILYRIDLNWIKYINKKQIDTSNLPSFIHVNKTTNYASIVDHKYTVKELYKNARLKGSSITINDLEYEPSITGHRLFLNGDLYKYDAGDYNGKIYYRDMEDSESWKYLDTKDLNYLNMYTGPCYTIDNLL